MVGVAVTPLPPQALSGLPFPERCLELTFPRAAIEVPDGRLLVGPLHLRTTPTEAIALALTIELTVGTAAMAELRHAQGHQRTGPDTGILTRVLGGLRDM